MNKYERAKVNKVKRAIEKYRGLEELYIEEDLPDDKYLLLLKVSLIEKFLDQKLTDEYWANKLGTRSRIIRHIRKVLKGKAYSGIWQ